ncbi:complex I NDUFA9 subunit family protein [Roseovarius spongiae]|uniref:Complex I NDUFA9 subunit family protein n=1 Tax=Roseovarius spongiae TaxID=2320272 RepID=A0A3A8AQE4_9RHOB|nr:complex I NDUFA9 subunit family protein [Roseovarius spongiae]RKF12637.1 complex I NDUFA9 subunit family protein [Roseovarius spongiae]
MRQERLITVFGGTGFLGSRIVARLLQGGCRVRVAARHPDRKPDLLRNDRSEACRADLHEPATLTAALKGADGAVNATSLYVEKGDLTYHAVHVDAAARLAALARHAGVRAFVQMSGIGADPDAQDSYVRARGEGERAVRAAHPEAVIARSAVMFGEGDALLSTIRDILRRSPVYPLFGAGDTRLQPAWVDDVAEAVARLLKPGARATPHELAGADIVTYRQLVERVAEATGSRARTVPVPFALWQPLAGLAEHLPGAPLTRAQVALMRIDNVASGSMPGMSVLGIAPRGMTEQVERRAGTEDGSEEQV